MKPADKQVLLAVNSALETAIAASSLSADVAATAGGSFPLIVTGQSTEVQERNYKDDDSPSVTRTLRQYGDTKLQALDLAELCIETLTDKTNVSVSGFKVADITLELSEPLDTITDTAEEYSYVQRYRFNLDPVST